MKDMITIYGSGCAKCAALAETTREALAKIGSEAEVVKETDFAKIAAAGIARTPALAVNGKLVFSGKAPDKETLKELLAERVSDARGNAAGASCACGGGCGCGGVAKNPPKKTLRRLVVWAVVLLALIAAVRLWNRTSRDAADAPASPAAGGDLLRHGASGGAAVDAARERRDFSRARRVLDTHENHFLKS